MTDLSAALMRLLRTAARLRSTLTASAGCDFPALQVLSAVDGRGPARVTALADLLAQDASVVSRAVASLEQSGLATREPDPHDGRASLVTLTERGRTLALEHAARRDALIEAVTADWSPADREQFAGLLDRFADGLGARLAASPMSETRESA